jgi:serine-type D-Ala-D-Ala carboxypeptidase (penicillin-binding protein 5/6)
MRVVHPSIYLKQQERKKRKRRGAFSIPIVLLALLTFYGYLAANVTPIYTVARTYPNKVNAQETPITWPQSGVASVGYSEADGQIIASNGGDTQLPVASTIKVLTALVVLERKPLGPREQGERIYFNNADVEMTNRIIAEGGAYYPITNGMSISYHQAIELLLIGSANNISEKLAIWAFGGLKEYTEAANLYLRANGMLDTIPSDPSGLLPTTKSTAQDMLKISLKAMELPVIREIVRMDKTDVNGIVITSTNRLLVDSTSYNGLKTGYTPEAGYCMIVTRSGTFNSKDYTFVAVVLGQPNRDSSFAQASRLVNLLYDGTTNQVILPAGSRVADIVAPWGAETRVVNRTALEGYRYPTETVEVEVGIEPLEFAEKSTTVGSARYRDRDVDVILDADLPQPSIWWRLTNALDYLEELL